MTSEDTYFIDGNVGERRDLLVGRVTTEPGGELALCPHQRPHPAVSGGCLEVSTAASV